MKSSIVKTTLVLILITISSVVIAQTNPWKQNNTENPWVKSDSIQSPTKSVSVIEESPKKADLTKEDSTTVKPTAEKAEVIQESPTDNSVSTNGNEVLFNYPTSRVLMNVNSERLDFEMNNHVRHHYKSRAMFWSNLGITLASITTSIASGSSVGVFGILGGLIASGFSSNKTKEALSAFKADNPNVDERIIKKYERKLRSKKMASGIGGIGVGLGVTVATAVATFIAVLVTL